VRVGAIEVTPLYDGSFSFPVDRFFPTTSPEDWAPHRELLTDDGMMK